MSALTMPIEAASSITPSDSTTFNPTRGLYVGVSGDVKVTTVGGDTVTLGNLAAGIMHPIRVIKVFSTDTTATEIMGLY